MRLTSHSPATYSPEYFIFYFALGTTPGERHAAPPPAGSRAAVIFARSCARCRARIDPSVDARSDASPHKARAKPSADTPPLDVDVTHAASTAAGDGAPSLVRASAASASRAPPSIIRVGSVSTPSSAPDVGTLVGTLVGEDEGAGGGEEACVFDGDGEGWEERRERDAGWGAFGVVGGAEWGS